MNLWQSSPMKCGELIIILLFLNCLNSCVSLEEKRQLEAQKIEELKNRYKREASQRRTWSQGKLAALRYQRDKGFSIMRYDFPMFRSGYWPHYAIYEHFGIEEGAEPFGTFEFYKGWNAEMDRLLLARYGSEYLKYRNDVIPPPDARADQVRSFLFQPSDGYGVSAK